MPLRALFLVEIVLILRSTYSLGFIEKLLNYPVKIIKFFVPYLLHCVERSLPGLTEKATNIIFYGGCILNYSHHFS